MELPPQVEKEQNAINYSRYLNDTQDSWTSCLNIMDDDDNDLFKLRDFAAQFCLAGLTQFEQNIVITYGMIPSALSHQLPLLLLSGLPGCGKTQAAIFLDKLRGGNNILNGGNITYAGIRNLVQVKRFPSGNMGKERNCLVILDDLKTDKLLNDDSIYSFLRGSYSRETDLMTRAGVDAGTVMEFRSFCAKVLTSIDNLYNHPQLTELARRALPIRFKKADVSEQLSFDDYTWEGFNEIYDNYWSNIDNVQSFVYHKKKLRTQLKKVGIPSVLLDFLTTYYVYGNCSDYSLTIDFGLRIEEYCQNLKIVQDSPAKQLCEAFLKQLLELEKLEAIKKESPPPTKVMRFKPYNLNTFVAREKDNASLNLNRDIAPELNSLGYFLSYDQSSQSLMWIYRG